MGSRTIWEIPSMEQYWSEWIYERSSCTWRGCTSILCLQLSGLISMVSWIRWRKGFAKQCPRWWLDTETVSYSPLGLVFSLIITFRNVRRSSKAARTAKLTWCKGIKERGQPATSPIVEELNLGHVETGWSVRVRNRMVRPGGRPSGVELTLHFAGNYLVRADHRVSIWLLIRLTQRGRVVCDVSCYILFLIQLTAGRYDFFASPRRSTALVLRIYADWHSLRRRVRGNAYVRSPCAAFELIRHKIQEQSV
jgi:hypothetical protein